MTDLELNNRNDIYAVVRGNEEGLEVYFKLLDRLQLIANEVNNTVVPQLDYKRIINIVLKSMKECEIHLNTEEEKIFKGNLIKNLNG